MKKFVLNTDTGVLHYKGLCCHTEYIDCDKDVYRCYATEDDAKALHAISVRWCKICAKKRKIV